MFFYGIGRFNSSHEPLIRRDFDAVHVHSSLRVYDPPDLHWFVSTPNRGWTAERNLYLECSETDRVEEVYNYDQGADPAWRL